MSSDQDDSHKQGKKASADTNQQVPRQMNDRHEWLQRTTKTLLETKPGSFNKGKWHELVSILNAWSSSRDVSAPIVMESLLKRLIEERAAGNSEAKACVHDYNLVIEAWGHLASKSTLEGKLAARRARDILLSLQRTYEATQDPDCMPTSRSFVVVLSALSKAGDVSGCKNMLKWMETLHESERNVQANTHTSAYAYALNAIASNGSPTAGKETEDLIQHMNATGIEPNTLCYTIAVKAWAKGARGRQGAEHAERLLEEMPVKPDVYTYSTVITAWSSSGMKDHAAERAEAILKKLEDDPDVQPNGKCLFVTGL
jgi:hypothetical protein